MSGLCDEDVPPPPTVPIPDPHLVSPTMMGELSPVPPGPPLPFPTGCMQVSRLPCKRATLLGLSPIWLDPCRP